MNRLIFKAAILVLIALAGALAEAGQMDGPMPGEPAPDFTLNLKDGSGSVTLSDQQGRPTVLIFASYT